ncbi:MAG: hypothetical protein KIC94_20905 [Clostridiales bacterium]|nr:hypothetical protein [Clostridiales bacterium]
MDKGKEEPYGSALQKILKYGQEIVVVTYKYVDGILRLSDAWVR